MNNAPKLRQTVQYSIAQMELKKCKADLAKQVELNDNLLADVNRLNESLEQAKTRLATIDSDQ